MCMCHQKKYLRAWHVRIWKVYSESKCSHWIIWPMPTQMNKSMHISVRSDEFSHHQDIVDIRGEGHHYFPRQLVVITSGNRTSNLRSHIQCSTGWANLGGLTHCFLVSFQDYVTVLIGRPFLETSSMLLAFETYCTAQSSAQNLLEQLMEEKNLLRLFLDESLKENEALRRMDLKTFLMVPVQRVMKWVFMLPSSVTFMPDFCLQVSTAVREIVKNHA